MDELRDRLAALDRISVPDLWPEIARRAWQRPSPVTSRTGWVPSAPGSMRRIVPVLAAHRSVMIIGSLALVSTALALAGAPAVPRPGLFGGPGPSPSTDGSPSLGPAIVWDSGSVRLEADSVEIRAGDRVFHGQAPYRVDSDPGDPTYRTLEVEWTEAGLEQRLYVYFGADEQDWWVTEVRTRDGLDPVDWITYEGELLLATPRGETYEGELHLVGGDGRVPGELTIEGLRLTAFAPGSGPGPLTGCEHVRASVRGSAEPLDKGQPLAGTGIETMSPEAAEGLLREMGLCFTFRYLYPTTEDRSQGYSERWCTAPPAGTVSHLHYLDDGEVVVFVDDDRVMPVREQPPEGWDCPAG
jgi:hypothetical protein